MSALRKVVESTCRDVQHATIVFKKRITYVLDCGHVTVREVDPHVTPSKRLKCASCDPGASS